MRGPGVGAPFRKIYVRDVEATPWLYEFHYSRLWRHRWFARASKGFVGRWCGRQLISLINRFDPDVILSTYPPGKHGPGLAARHRGLGVPTRCWISDFAPHPFWVYRELDGNHVMDPAAVLVDLAAEPEAKVVPDQAGRWP